MKSETLTQLTKVFSYLFNAVFVIDHDGNIVEWNEHAAHLFGYSREEVLGAPGNIIFPTELKQALADKVMKKIVDQGFWNDKVEFEHKNGTQGWIESIVIADNNQEPVGCVWASRDVTQWMQDRQALMEKALRDQLTQLGNRRYIYDYLGRLIEEKSRINGMVGVLFLDLDGFKNINDQYGHESGDLVLQEAAIRLQQAIRGSDVVARLAGDEFVVILDQLHEKENIKLVRSRVIEALKEPIQINGGEIVVSASMGYAIFPNDGTTPRELIKSADKHMYNYKRKLKASVQERLFLGDNK